MTKRIVFPREVLLVEVERRCGEPPCGARMSREWRRLGGEREAAPDEAEVKRGGSF